MDQNILSEKTRNTDKRRPKGEIKFAMSLNDEQKAAKSEILKNTVTLLRGQAGSGKTLLACQVALDLYFTRQIEKIIITRPVVEAADPIGFLPGDMKAKMDPWLAPIYANLYMLYNKEHIDKMVENQSIEILPFSFVRGRTFIDSVVIVDECQNITHSQTEMMLGRLGKGGKIVFCGDISQVDLKSKKDSGIGFFNNLESRIKGVRIIVLKKNHRHEIVEEILKIYEEFRD